MKNTRSIRETIKQNGIVTNKLSGPIGDEGKIIRVDPMDCYIYEGAQRELNVKHAQEIADNFQWDKAKVPSGYLWNSAVYITDGQHTITGAAASGVKSMFVYIFELPDDATLDEVEIVMAEQFASINGDVKKMDRFTTHKIDLLRRRPAALKVQEVCNATAVSLIPPAKKKQAIPGSLSHVESAYKMVMNIGEHPTKMSLAFQRNYWPHDVIDSNIAWGLSRFFKEFEPFKLAGDDGAQYDELIMFKALSNDKCRTKSEIYTHLHALTPSLHLPSNTRGDIWLGKAMRHTYNAYVTRNSLNVPLLDSFIF